MRNTPAIRALLAANDRERRSRRIARARRAFNIVNGVVSRAARASRVRVRNTMVRLTGNGRMSRIQAAARLPVVYRGLRAAIARARSNVRNRHALARRRAAVSVISPRRRR